MKLVVREIIRSYVVNLAFRWLSGGDITASANAGDVRDPGSIPGSERFPWRRTQQPIQYSCHLFLISYVSVRSIPFLSFIEPIFA